MFVKRGAASAVAALACMLGSMVCGCAVAGPGHTADQSPTADVATLPEALSGADSSPGAERATSDAPRRSDLAAGTERPTRADGFIGVPDMLGRPGEAGTVVCPSALPTAGGACPASGLVCGYGTDPRLSCRPSATCTTTGWSVNVPPCSTPPPVCPAAPTTGTCPATGMSCGYATAGTTCDCWACLFPCTMSPTWHCVAPPAGCPTSAPNFGEPCAKSGLVCDYGSCTGGYQVTCSGGIWVRSKALCPA